MAGPAPSSRRAGLYVCPTRPVDAPGRPFPIGAADCRRAGGEPYTQGVAIDERVLTPTEVGRILRVSEVTVRRMVARGVLPRVAGIRVVLIPRDAVERLLGGPVNLSA